MRIHEFDQWERYHGHAFPATVEWLAARPTETRELWFKTLAPVELEDARAATEAMLAGELGGEEGYSKTATLVRKFALARAADRRMAANNRSLYVNGERTVGCRDCEDRGFILVWLAVAVKAAVEGRLFDRVHNPRGGYQGGVSGVAACTCEAGSRRMAQQCGYARFDPLWMPRFDHGAMDRYEPLMAWLRERGMV